MIADAEVKDSQDARVTAARRYFMQIGTKVFGAGFFVGFEETYYARMGRSSSFKRQNGRKRCVEAVAVVCRASSVKTVVLYDRQPRAESFRPAVGFRLLVEVSVKKTGRPVCPSEAGRSMKSAGVTPGFERISKVPDGKRFFPH